MKVTRLLPAFWRRKATRFALVSGIITVAACWWLLPYSARNRLELPKDKTKYVRDVVLSSDFTKAIVCESKTALEDYIGKILKAPGPNKASVFDVATGQRLFFRNGNFEEGYSFRSRIHRRIAISPDNQYLVDVTSGKIKYYKIPSGESCEPDPNRRFPEKSEWTDVVLCGDSQGRLLVVVNDTLEPNRIYDWHSGKVFSEGFPYADVFMGGFVELDNEEWVFQIRAFPTARLQGKVKIPEPIYAQFFNLTALATKGLTPDCKTLVLVNGKVHVWDVPSGTQRDLDILAEEFLAISPDGRYLAVRNRLRGDPHPWLAWLMNWLAINSSGHDFVLYDLPSETVVTTIRNADWAQFSLDGQSLAIITDDTLNIYDFPLRKPWLKIAVCGVTAAAIAGLLAWLLGLRGKKSHRAGSVSDGLTQ